MSNQVTLHSRIYFCQKITIVLHPISQVNEEVRQRMFSLRHTWNEVFQPTKLYELDVSVNQIDPKWPIVQPRTAPSIHVNPNFLSLTVSTTY